MKEDSIGVTLLTDMARSIQGFIPKDIHETSNSMQGAVEYLLALGALAFAFAKTGNIIALLLFAGLIMMDILVSLRRFSELILNRYNDQKRGLQLYLPAVLYMAASILGTVLVIWLGTDLGKQ